MLSEFMKFLAQNNIIWIAIWLLIATKVGELVKSLIEDLITPLILAPAFKKLKVENLEEMSKNGVLYWKVIARVIEFIVIAFLVFLMVHYLGIQTK